MIQNKAEATLMSFFLVQYFGWMKLLILHLRFLSILKKDA